MSRGRVPLGMFLFFSNRLGCVGSITVTALGTLLILVLLGWISV